MMRGRADTTTFRRSAAALVAVPPMVALLLALTSTSASAACLTTCAGSNGYGDPICTTRCTELAQPSGRSGPPAAPVRRQSWGAIASNDVEAAYSYNHSSRGMAEQSARAECNRLVARGSRKCVAVNSFADTCGAFAMAKGGGFGTIVARTEKEARRASLEECSRHKPKEPCAVVIGFCTPR